jgi:hypothetical protein
MNDDVPDFIENIHTVDSPTQTIEIKRCSNYLMSRDVILAITLPALSAVKIYENYPDTNVKTISVGAGTFVFKRGTPNCGDTAAVVLPHHGDIGCPCKPCMAYAIKEQYSQKGWHLSTYTP